MAVGSENRPANANAKRTLAKPETEKVDVQAVLRVRPFTAGEIDAADTETIRIDGCVFFAVFH